MRRRRSLLMRSYRGLIAVAVTVAVAVAVTVVVAVTVTAVAVTDGGVGYRGRW